MDGVERGRKSLTHFEEVEAKVVDATAWKVSAEINVVDVFEHEGWNFRVGVKADIEELDDVPPATKCLEDRDLATDLPRLDRFQYLCKRERPELVWLFFFP